MASAIVAADTAGYCFLDFDINNHRAKLAQVAAFVDSCDSKYGFSSKVLRSLGGSELSRIPELILSDHEWSSKANAIGVEVRPPLSGNRIVLKLFWDTAPLACENFATLCANGSIMPGSNDKKVKPVPVGESGKPLTYRGSIVHRIVPKFIVQGGDFVFGNGSGGESIYNGKKFKDERAGLLLKHAKRGVLSMGNSGKNSNTSQWFITFQAAPQCDGKHVVFGELLSGWEVLDALEAVGTTEGEPVKSVTITDCGIWKPFLTPGSGYWYDQPDEDSYTGVSPIFIVRPRVAVLAPNQSALDKFNHLLAGHCMVTPVNGEEYVDSAAQVRRLSELLGRFEIDLIIVAPVFKGVHDLLDLPPLWVADGPVHRIALDAVAFIAKPVEAMDCIRSQSWLTLLTSWQLGSY